MDRTIERRPRSPFALVDLRGEDLLAAPGQRPTRDGFLATDMYETETSYIVKVALPGVSPDDLKITRVGDTVTLEGELKHTGPEDATYLYRERSHGRFSRTLALPEDARNDVSAALENGVLSLEFSKPEESVPHTIRVTTAE